MTNPREPKRTVSVLSLLTVISLAVFGMGCSSTPAPASTDATTSLAMKYDACLLLAKADAEATVGGAVKDPLRNVSQTDQGKISVSSCTYSQPLPSNSTDISKIGSAGLLVRKATNNAEAVKVFADAKAASKNMSGVEPVVIAGLGDQAYWSGGNLNQMNVLKGDAWYIVTLRIPSGDIQAKARELAKKIIEKIN